jgi:putative ABC transport system ATP-binding protein
MTLTLQPLVSLDSVIRTVQLPDGDDLEILSGVNLEVFPEEHISIIGRSGTGKSTLLNILGLLDRPTAGELLWDGRDAGRFSARTATAIRGQEIGFVFQQFNLLQGRTATENVAAPLLYGSERDIRQRRRLALEMLDRLGIADRGDQLPHQLSGGEQQRVAIARALIRNPRLVLADEPTGALDVETGQTVMELLESTTREFAAALITITHDPNVAARASRCLRLEGGKLQAQAEETSGRPV